jgi:hypothetical protein
MANAKKTKHKAALLGLGLDSDSHKRVKKPRRSIFTSIHSP